MNMFCLKYVLVVDEDEGLVQGDIILGRHMC